jgi:putative peptidoglycan lipid II flippase
LKTSEANTNNNKANNGAFFVALGIFLSRIAGLIRERTFAHYFGNSLAGDAFKAALKIPNFLQNLLGEGVLSASMIPVYASLRAQGKNQEADDTVRTVGTFLFFLTSLFCAMGILMAPFMIAVIAPGFEGEKAALTIQLVQIFFPGISLLVMSAWCLGILNTHRKFFLSYVAPVVWNVAIIASLIFYGNHYKQNQLAVYTAWGLVLGSALQLLIQLPSVSKLLLSWKPSFKTRSSGVSTVFRNFVPTALTRGVVQLSAYIDSMLASYLPTGAVSALAYAQTLYLLPVSLFGMSVSAAELPRMSEAVGDSLEVEEFNFIGYC